MKEEFNQRRKDLIKRFPTDCTDDQLITNTEHTLLKAYIDLVLSYDEAISSQLALNLEVLCD